MTGWIVAGWLALAAIAFYMMARQMVSLFDRVTLGDAFLIAFFALLCPPAMFVAVGIIYLSENKGDFFGKVLWRK